MGRTGLLRVSFASGVLAVSYSATQAWAQVGEAPATQSASDSGDQSLQEVVVTAQRRAQSIQDVGISITALSGQTLAETGITSSQGIAAHVPGLQFDSGSGGGVNAFVAIRGVTQVDPSEHQEGPNAVYLDGVYVPTPSEVGFPLYDMARAEVLRGPQGTLFGRNSTGGLVQFITEDPSDVNQGYIDASYGNYSLYKVEGAFGGPITEGLDFRVAGFATKGDGMFHNYDPGQNDSFSTNTFGFRAKLLKKFNSGWNALLTVSLNEQPRHNEGVYKSTPAYVDANGVTQYLPANVNFYGTGPGKDPFGYRDTNPDPWSGSFLSAPGFLGKQYKYATLKVEGPIPGATLTSITSYSSGSLNYSEDTDSTPNDINTFGNGGNTDMFTEDLRLNGQNERVNWTTGVFYLNVAGSYYLYFAEPYLDSTTPVHLFNAYDQHTRSYAAYGQVEYKLTQSLKAIVGARYTYDQKDFNSIVYDQTTQPNTVIYDFNPATVGGLAHMEDGGWTGKFQLDYQPRHEVLLYAGVSRGWRGGGFNSNEVGSTPLLATPFRAETMLDYEGGVKLIALDDRVSVRAGTFYYDYRDYQAFNFQSTSGSVGNNDADFYGGELELSAHPLTGLDVSLGSSINHGKIKDYKTPSGAVIDAEPLKAPHYTFNGIIAKGFDVGQYRVRAQYDFDYDSMSNANLVPSPVTTLPASYMQNARLSVASKKAGWEVYAFINNLANRDRKTYGYDLSFVGMALASYAPPRTYGVGLRDSF